jgi:hypothetical protein
MTHFQDVANICNMKTEYDELISSMSVPYSRKQLTVENAKWFIDHGARYNSKSVNYKKLYYVCSEFLAMEKKYGYIDQRSE